MTTRLMPLMLVAALLACGSGCAKKPDWVQQTLVTVDVTGTWLGSCRGRSFSIPTIGMILAQSGSKVTGQGNTPGSTSVRWGAEGSINGDVFRFNPQSGPGEFQVNGDEMSGSL